MLPYFKKLNTSGVIHVMQSAKEHGYNHEWINFGQGAPEVSSAQIKMKGGRDYAPVDGLADIRKRISDYYNHFFRTGKTKYSYENVCVCGGGRNALTRIFASLENIKLAYFVPEYASYEGILKAFHPNRYPIYLKKENNFEIDIDELRHIIKKNSIKGILISNPNNPTGRVIHGQKLMELVGLAKKTNCLIIFDEFYSHYFYPDNSIISSAEFIKDIENEPVIIVNGITKGWRCPGWRIAWVVGHKSFINVVTQAGSFLDGGANHPAQLMGLSMLDLDLTKKEIAIIKRIFLRKRDYLIKGLRELNINARTPLGSFYVWADLSNLPTPICTGEGFFIEGLKERIVSVPGIYFDINPDIKRAELHHYTRLSFGPEFDKIKEGLMRIKRIVSRFK